MSEPIRIRWKESVPSEPIWKAGIPEWCSYPRGSWPGGSCTQRNVLRLNRVGLCLMHVRMVTEAIGDHITARAGFLYEQEKDLAERERDFARRYNAWRKSVGWKAKAQGFVYYIHDPRFDLIKIGCAFDPVARLVALKLHPDCEMIWVEPGGRSLEMNRHKQFSTLRSKHPDGGQGYTEWFKYGSELRAFIQEREISLERKKVRA